MATMTVVNTQIIEESCTCFNRTFITHFKITLMDNSQLIIHHLAYIKELAEVDKNMEQTTRLRTLILGEASP
jgi:hypothetical protein